MMPRRAQLGRLGLLIIAVILATMVFGWVGPVFAGVVFVALDGRDSGPGEVARGAGMAWTLIFLLSLASTGTRPVAVIGAALGVSAFALPVASILFAAGLGWSSAALTLALRGAIFARRAPQTPESLAAR